MMLEIEKSFASGKVIVPPSKSYAHRYLIASSLSKGTNKISNIEMNDDILATLSCIRNFSKKYLFENNEVIISDELNNQEPLIFECNESGSTLRFLIPLALTIGKQVIFKGSKRLFLRGIDLYLDIFKKQNIDYILKEDMLILNGKLKADDFIFDDVISSQFITGLLFALPLLDEDSSIKIPEKMQSKSYLNITLDVLKKFGIKIVINKNEILIKGNQKYVLNDFVNEGDYSNAAFIDALNYLDGNVEILGLTKDSYQGDKIYKEFFDLLSKKNTVIDLGNSIDLGPILIVFASIKKGASFINYERLKIKESNRVESLKSELKKCNVEIFEKDGLLIVDNKNLSKPKEILKSHNDHRIAMALSILCSYLGGKIDGVECVKKSYPSFYEDLKKIGIKIKEVGDEL